MAAGGQRVEQEGGFGKTTFCVWTLLTLGHDADTWVATGRELPWPLRPKPCTRTILRQGRSGVDVSVDQTYRFTPFYRHELGSLKKNHPSKRLFPGSRQGSGHTDSKLLLLPACGRPRLSLGSSHLQVNTDPVTLLKPAVWWVKSGLEFC